MSWPITTDEAFNLSSSRIEEEEVEKIREAVRVRRIRVAKHAQTRAFERGLSIGDVTSILLGGAAVEKDLPHNQLGRQPGLSFVGVGPSGVKAKVKITFVDNIGYEVVTIHPVEDET